jgi:hypothetical protein
MLPVEGKRGRQLTNSTQTHTHTQVRKNAEARTTSKISRLQTLVHKDDRRAKSEQHRAMRLLHMSHKLQAQAAQLLDDSTHDIMLEESEA